MVDGVPVSVRRVQVHAGGVSVVSFRAFGGSAR
jgi:hypothetical protein